MKRPWMLSLESLKPTYAHVLIKQFPKIQGLAASRRLDQNSNPWQRFHQSSLLVDFLFGIDAEEELGRIMVREIVLACHQKYIQLYKRVARQIPANLIILLNLSDTIHL